MGRLTREAAKIVSDCVRKMEEDLAKQGMTIDDWVKQQNEKNDRFSKRKIKVTERNK